MLKVLIADDEKNICLMIQKLIVWSDFNMEIGGIVHNGVDAVKFIKTNRPDVVISDIRMPGLDGLELIQKVRDMNLTTEFIIISGYKYFEYAHKALNLGVEHYLLKPIDRAELEHTLGKIIHKRNINLEKTKKEEALMEQARFSRRSIQKHFLNTIMQKNRDTNNLEINQVNAEFQCEFEQGMFRAVFAKVDCNTMESDLSGLLHMIEETFDNDLSGYNIQYITSVMKSGVFSVVNYSPERKEELSDGIEVPFHKIRREFDKFKGYHITFGIGREKSSISEISDSIQEAIYAVKCRGKLGTDKIIYFEQLPYTDIPIEKIMDEKVCREIENITESLDSEAYNDAVMRALKDIRSIPFYSPTVVYDYIEKAGEITLRVLKNNHTDEKLFHTLNEDIQKCMDFYVEPSDMSYRFTEIIRSYFEKIATERKNRSQRPIRLAKKYVQDNFYTQVTLEDVADAINLSPAYLSTMFKKEMGLGFVDYLISCRMEAAREMLKTSDLSINEIAEKVGYTDSRHFSKTFNKVVGLKPSAYRRLYR